MYYVYLVRCKDGSLYCGVTTDVRRRVEEHNGGLVGAKYTRSRRPVWLAWKSPGMPKRAALAMERGLKRMSKADKEGFVRNSDTSVTP